ncbi:hypothetical protein GQ43DRAFT_140875 [Delitschia confertaspora ATCC 74209]|uniref:Secreted protein n=1 Tax=Delitschia confertaspora ATCC 74209 TaxID=1513339 RepID=A0A9P4JSN3_9PLEO|nr:hypothetical protein GQ43DRAFT_140875 [Delitschia confertaspora ATCC 74209]
MGGLNVWSLFRSFALFLLRVFSLFHSPIHLYYTLPCSVCPVSVTYIPFNSVSWPVHNSSLLPTVEPNRLSILDYTFVCP